MRPVSKSSTWKICGKVQMEPFGTSWTVGDFLRSITNSLWIFNLITYVDWKCGFYLLQGQYLENQSYARTSLGLCQVLIMSYCTRSYNWGLFPSFNIMPTNYSILRLDQADMHRETCFWWSVSSYWCSIWRSWKTQNGFWYVCSCCLAVLLHTYRLAFKALL